MNQSSAIRKISGVWQRQQKGKRCSISPAEMSRRRSPRSATICSAASAGAEPVQPAEVRVEAAGLVDGHHDREVVHARELEVLGAAARRDVDDPGALLERHVLPGDHPVLDLLGGRQVVERPLVAEPDEVGAAGALDELLVGRQRRPPTIRRPAGARTRPRG